MESHEGYHDKFENWIPPARPVKKEEFSDAYEEDEEEVPRRQKRTRKKRPKRNVATGSDDDELARRFGKEVEAISKSIRQPKVAARATLQVKIRKPRGELAACDVPQASIEGDEEQTEPSPRARPTISDSEDDKPVPRMALAEALTLRERSIDKLFEGSPESPNEVISDENSQPVPQPSLEASNGSSTNTVNITGAAPISRALTNTTSQPSTRTIPAGNTR